MNVNMPQRHRNNMSYDHKAYMREYNRANSGRHKEWREQNPERWAEIQRRSRYKRRYGITPERYEEMVVEQDGRCAICGSDDPKGPGGRFAVDHDHETGEVRSLLCSTCNTGLGMFQDDVTLLAAAAEYLTSHTGARGGARSSTA